MEILCRDGMVSDVDDDVPSCDEKSPLAKEDQSADQPVSITDTVETKRYAAKRIFGRHGAYPCEVCKLNPSKYKFRCCRFGYCSTDCFKKHSEAGSCSNQSNMSTNVDRPTFKRRATNVRHSLKGFEFIFSPSWIWTFQKMIC